MNLMNVVYLEIKPKINNIKNNRTFRIRNNRNCRGPGSVAHIFNLQQTRGNISSYNNKTELLLGMNAKLSDFNLPRHILPKKKFISKIHESF